MTLPPRKHPWQKLPLRPLPPRKPRQRMRPSISKACYPAPSAGKQKKNALPFWQSIDISPHLGYTKHRKGAASRRLPIDYREVTGAVGGWRLLLFIICLDDQGNDSSNDHAELKNSFPCNIHACHPLSQWIGGKRSGLPPKGGTACRGAGSTIHSLSQNAANCKQNTYKCGKKPLQQWKSVL